MSCEEATPMRLILPSLAEMMFAGEHQVRLTRRCMVGLPREGLDGCLLWVDIDLKVYGRAKVWWEKWEETE